MAGQGGYSTDFDGTGTNGAVTNTSPAKGTVINTIRDNCIALAGRRAVYHLTSNSKRDRYRCTTADTYQDHPDYLDVTINWTALKGDVGDVFTVVVKVWALTDNATTTITPRLVTAGTTTENVAGAAEDSTSGDVQSLTVDPAASGTVTYRLQIKQADLNYDVGAVATLEIYA